jgi:acetyl-CoA acetyltransferase
MREGYIPYCAYWSTPFARWQGSFAHLHALKFGASTAKAELARRNMHGRTIAALIFAAASTPSRLSGSANRPAEATESFCIRDAEWSGARLGLLRGRDPRRRTD